MKTTGGKGSPSLKRNGEGAENAENKSPPKAFFLRFLQGSSQRITCLDLSHTNSLHIVHYIHESMSSGLGSSVVIKYNTKK